MLWPTLLFWYSVQNMVRQSFCEELSEVLCEGCPIRLLGEEQIEAEVQRNVTPFWFATTVDAKTVEAETMFVVMTQDDGVEVATHTDDKEYTADDVTADAVESLQVNILVLTEHPVVVPAIAACIRRKIDEECL